MENKNMRAIAEDFGQRYSELLGINLSSGKGTAQKARTTCALA
jgi:hypothetical protein